MPRGRAQPGRGQSMGAATGTLEAGPRRHLSNGLLPRQDQPDDALDEALVAVGRVVLGIGEDHPPRLLAEVADHPRGELSVQFSRQLPLLDRRAHEPLDLAEDSLAILFDVIAHDLGCPLERQQDQAPCGRPADHGVEETPDAGREELDRILAGVLGYDESELAERVMLLALDERMKQPREIREVVIHDRPSDSGLARNRLDRDPAIPIFENHVERRIDQLLPPLLRRHPRRIAPPRAGIGSRGCAGNGHGAAASVAENYAGVALSGPSPTLPRRTPSPPCPTSFPESTG